MNVQLRQTTVVGNHKSTNDIEDRWCFLCVAILLCRQGSSALVRMYTAVGSTSPLGTLQSGIEVI